MRDAETLLRDIWDTYKASDDGLKVADKVIRANALQFIQKTDFPLMADAEAKQRLRNGSDHLTRLTVLSMWVVFERFIIDYLQDKGNIFKELKPGNLADPLREKFESSIEYWKFDDILDMFKPVVGSALVGDVKNIKKFRDSIAHTNPRKRQPDPWKPKETYDRLTQFIQKL